MKLKIKHSIMALLISYVFLSIITLETIPYKIHNSIIFSGMDTTDTKLTVILNTVLPINKENTSSKIVTDSVKLNGKRTNEYFTLELYRTHLHYLLGIKYNSVLTNDIGKIVTHKNY